MIDNRTKMLITVPINLLEEFDSVAKINNKTRSAAVREAMQLYIKYVDKLDKVSEELYKDK